MTNIAILDLTEQHHRGNLFTLFLHSPLMGMCLVSSLCDVPMNLWEKCQALVDRFIAEASKLLTRSRNVGMSSYSMPKIQKQSETGLQLW